MINKEKCSKWCGCMLDLIHATSELTDNEAEYIKQSLNIAFAEEKIKELEAKDENNNTITMQEQKE